MHQYGVREVERLLRLPRNAVRSLVAAGFVTPRRGPRNAWRFSFRDLIVLRTAQALAQANVPHRRIVRALRELRRRLPAQMPLSGLSIGAVADHVVVREGSRRWHAESGQYLLAFEGDPATGVLRMFEPGAAPTAIGTPDWHARGLTLEATHAEGALRAYARAIAAHPARLDARINLGRLLHELGRFEEAERAYHDALARGTDPLLFYNLGVLYEDAGRKTEAVRAYEAALHEDPDLADAHYNLALLYEELGQPRHAIRHMSRYRRLTARSRGD